MKVVVIVGASGVTDAVVAAVDEALRVHGLIKVRINAADRNARKKLAAEICGRADAELVQTIGHVAVLFREPDDDKLRQAFSKVLD